MKIPSLGSALLLLVPLAHAQTWTQLAPATSPAAQFAHGMVHDVARGRTVLYGGFSSFVSSFETWEWDGTTWAVRVFHPNPGDRDSHVMTYDPIRNVTILWGGWNSLRQKFDDTWEYDGLRWSRNSTPTRPPKWLSGRMVFDAVRQRAVLFGGYDHATMLVHDETWEYDGADWSRVVTATAPPARAEQAMAYDAARGVVVMFGGWVPNSPPLGDTWEYDGTDWVLVSTANAPAPRQSAAGCYDPARAVVVVHGGSDGGGAYADTWEYDGTDWTLATAAGPARSSHAQVYDATHGKMLIWGGFDGTSALTNATWVYEGAPVASWVPFGAGCAGSAGTPVLAPFAGSRPTLGTTYVLELGNLPLAGGLAYLITGFDNTSWNGLSLPLELSQFGLIGCHGLVAPAPGFGRVLVPAGGSAQWSLTLPTVPALAGLRFHSQGVSFDAGAVNGIAAFSNAGTSTAR